MTGPYSVVLLCDCRERHGCGYIVRHVTRQEAETAAVKFSQTNNHATMIVLSNGTETIDYFQRLHDAITASR